MNEYTGSHMHPGKYCWILAVALSVWVPNAVSRSDLCECVGDTLDCTSRYSWSNPKIKESLDICNDEVTKLNISYISLPTFPNISDRITEVYATNCGIQKLTPESLGQNIEVLLLTYNQIRFRNFSLKTLSNLKKLKMNHRRKSLKSLEFLPSPCSLLHLDVSSIRLQSLSGIEECKQLEWLDISETELILDENSFLGFDNLRFLGIQHKEFEDFPTNIFKNIPQLSDLDISNNLLSSLKKEDFLSLSELRSLTINAKNVVSPDIFSELKMLNELHLRSSKEEIHTLPDGFISNHNNLQILDVKGCRLESAHVAELSTLTELKKLDLSGNELLSIDETTFSKMNNLEWLSLINTNLCDLKRNSFATLVNLETLKFTATEVSEFPSGIFNELKNLKILEIEARQLSNLQPDIFSQQQHLERLSIRQANLKVQREIFENLVDLKELDLSYTHLSELPADLLKGLVKLEIFEARGCHLSDIPEDIFLDTGNLKHLVLSDNKFIEIPLSTFAKCASLVYLNMRNNLISSLPVYDVNIFPHLSHVDLARNKISEVSENIFRSWLPTGKRMNLLLSDNGMASPKMFRWAFTDTEIQIWGVEFLYFIIQKDTALLRVDLVRAGPNLMCGDNPCEKRNDFRAAAMFD